MARKKLTDDAMRAQLLAMEAARLAGSATKTLAAAKEVGIETEVVAPLPLDKTDRATLAGLTGVSDTLRKKLTGRARKFTVAEVISMAMAVAESLAAAEPGRRQSMLAGAARRLLYCVYSDVLMPAWQAEARKKRPTRSLYQLKVTLIGAQPAIWRRIQVKDCTLDKLHEHIQTSMGWTNSHLHHFDVGGQLYGDPELIEENFAEMNYRDSTITLLSDVVPKDSQRLQFQYEYDFGDRWEHEVLCEGCPKPQKGQQYPVCLEGERACPPEDVGGVWGYTKFLKTIKDRDDDERVGTLEWVEGWFDPDEFDAATATKSMWKGLSDWRSME